MYGTHLPPGGAGFIDEPTGYVPGSADYEYDDRVQQQLDDERARAEQEQPLSNDEEQQHGS